MGAKNFFVADDEWEGCDSSPLIFNPMWGNVSGPPAAAEIQRVKTVKNKKNPKKPRQKNGKSKDSAATTTPATPKVKSGRIEKKVKKQKKQKTLPQVRDSVESVVSSMTQSPSLGALTAKFKEQLVGGRFRYINEQLYTMDSLEAQQLFREDPEAFEAYHAGYRHQVEKWPLNPLDRIIKMIKKLPISLEIGDFGCGEGQLAKSVPHKVHSMDLVSCRDDIIACDMASTPLATQSLDVAVYCLSLMSTNLNDCLLEANRVLKMDAFLYIAEIQSRFDDVQAFIKCLEGCGFELLKKDVSVKLFYFFQFRKVRNVGKVVRLQQFSLKPCLYRKR